MTDMMLGQNTYVSTPQTNAQPSAAGSPGSGGPGANMSMTAAVAYVLVATGAISLASAYLARKGKKPIIGHFDVLDAVYNAGTVGVIFGTAKLLAYRYHGHKLSQAVLLVL